MAKQTTTFRRDPATGEWRAETTGPPVRHATRTRVDIDDGRGRFTLAWSGIDFEPFEGGPPPDGSAAELSRDLARRLVLALARFQI